MSLSVAKRYARALFDLLQGTDELESVLQELEKVSQVVQQSEELRRVIDHPQVQVEKKKNLLETVFSNSIGVRTRNFLFLLLDKKREKELQDIVGVLRQYTNEAHNVVDAYVTSAHSLQPEEEMSLAEALAREFGKEVRLHTSVESALIGGVQVRVGNRLYDGSIAGALKRFENRISLT